MNKKLLGSLGAIAIALVAFGLRVARINARVEKRESQSAALSKAQSVREVIGTQSTTLVNSSVKAFLSSLAEKGATNNTSTSTKYDKYTPIDGNYSLGQIGNKYYVVDVETKQQTPLDNVTEAYVVTIENKDGNWTQAAIVGKRDNKWYVYNDEGGVHGELGAVNITSATKKLIIENKKLTIE